MFMRFWQGPRSDWWAGGHHRGRHHGMRRFRRGILKFVLLKLLAELPRHGYDLIRAVRERGWVGGAGSVYPLLAGLEAAGLIVGRDEGDRRTYEITEKGRRLLEEHATDFKAFFEDEDDEEVADTPADLLRASASRLMQAVTQLGPSSKRETIERVSELLDGARKEIYELLAEE